MSEHASASGRAQAGRVRFTWSALFAYGQFGMPLAMAALPIYVHLPQYYAGELGVPLAALGAVLLGMRLIDAFVDPLLGAWSDDARSRKRLIAASAPFLAFGMIALFTPLGASPVTRLAWLAGALAVVYAAFSLATINHNAWGAELSADPVERTRITATREGLALVGVVIASLAPGVLAGAGGEAQGLHRFALAFAAVLAVSALVLVRFAPDASRSPVASAERLGIARVLRDPDFRRLLAVFVINGIASAIPATLLLFFVGDVLGVPERQGAFLACYFIAGACGMPLWVRLSAKFGKARAWQAGIVLAAATFVWAATLGRGDATAFAAVCVLSGLALGADLALPSSLLADVIGRRNAMRGAGAYFGVWTLATKLNLALAAGIALPLLAALGYAPSTRDAPALLALAIVYAGIPSALKLFAAVALWHFERHWQLA